MSTLSETKRRYSVTQVTQEWIIRWAARNFVRHYEDTYEVRVLCHECHGEKYHRTEVNFPECCGNYLDDGSCCGYHVHVTDHQDEPCRTCDATGIITIPYEDYLNYVDL